jgi:DNA-binding protein HU-beta
MTKMELIEALAKQSGLSRKDVDKLLDTFVSLVTDKLKAGEKVAVTGFGTFSVTERKARTGVNPQNPSQKIQIPAMKVPKFTAGKTFKDSLRG